MSEGGRGAEDSLQEPSAEAKAEMRRWLERWKIVNRVTRDEARQMTDDDVREALERVLEGAWDRRGTSDEGEGLMIVQQVLIDFRQRRSAHES